MKVLLVSAEWVFNSCPPSSQVNSRGSVHPFSLTQFEPCSEWGPIVQQLISVWGHCFLNLGVIYLGRGCSLTATMSLSIWCPQRLEGEHSNFRCLLTGIWEQAACCQQDSKFQTTWKGYRWWKQGQQNWEPLGPWVTKKLFHNSLMRAGLLLVKVFTLKTHFWKWSCFLCWQSSVWKP